MRKLILLLILLLLIFATLISTYEFDDNIAFTEDELHFIREHPVIKIGVDPKFKPFEFIDEHGEYLGVASDYQN